MRSVIVGTAGHIDHGKTSLVEALTGTNADRLPEERRRGITIDIGFAELALSDDVHIGFVDVPGHERFVRNMLAGAHGIDIVMLVVAADEGVMPQTREHFEICRLLDLRAGVICLTKLDAADAELRELVRAEVAELVAKSFLESAPVIETSARTREGLDDLRAALLEAARAVPERDGNRVMRLPIDRAFAMRGFGTIVTGTLVAGEVRANDELELLPVNRPVRVRGVQVHNRAAEVAAAGERTALNLGGVDAAEVERGQSLAPRGRLRPTQIFDARVSVLADAAHALKSRARVRLHVGAGEFLARVRVLEATGAIEPGAIGYVQVRSESPLVLAHGDRFILRAYSPARTIGGGIVLDPFAAKPRARELDARRTHLGSLESGTPGELLAAFVRAAGERGLTTADVAARTSWTNEHIREAARAAIDRGKIADADGVFVDEATTRALAESAARVVAAHHTREPLARGIRRETLREQVFAHAAPEIFRYVLAEAERGGLLVSERDTVRLRSHTTELAGEDARLHRELETIYREAGVAAPTADEALARIIPTPAKREHGRKLLRRLTQAGTLVSVAPDLLLHRDALESLVSTLRAHADKTLDRSIDVATFKDLAGVSRKYAIPILEYFDRERITRRAGDRRIVA